MVDDRDLTRPQRLALALDRDLSVLAGAGTGKTAVLTRRYMRILEETPHGPRSIIAVTYTKKAAGGMRKRITEAIGRRIEAAVASDDDAAYARWVSHRRALADATITTIHGLAARILRTFALDLGIDPDFRVLDEEEAGRLLDEAVAAVVRRVRVTDDGPLLRFVLKHRASRLRTALKALVGDPEWAHALQGTLGRDPDDQALLDRLARAVVGLDEDDLDRFLDDIEDVSRRFLDHPKPPQAGTKMATLHALLGACRDAGGLSWSDKAAAVAALTRHFRRSSGGPYAAPGPCMGKADLWSDHGGTEACRKLFDGLNQILEDLILRDPPLAVPGSYDAELIAQNRAVLALHADVTTAYRRLKERLGALDYGDLERQAAHALRTRPGLASEMRRHVRHILVDEFQDTNAAQWDIIRLLAAEDAETATIMADPTPYDPDHPAWSGWSTAEAFFETPAKSAAIEDDILRLDAPDGPLSPVDVVAEEEEDAGLLAADKLFIVGDEKQGIYRFRGADIEVYLESRRLVQETNRRNGTPDRAFPALLPDLPEDVPQNEDEGTGLVRLDTSFRSRRDLVRFSNAFFDRLLADDGNGGPFEARPGPLRPAPVEDGRHPGSVRLLLCPKGATGDDAEESDDERAYGQLVAHLRQAVTDGTMPIVTQDGEKSAGYDDIAILLRTRTGLKVLERVLRSAEIPFTVHGGRGLWETQEVWDLVHLLTHLADREDDIAFVGLLRSPMFAWTDTAIARLMRYDGASGWSRLGRMVADGATDTPGAAVPPHIVRDLLRSWRARLGLDPMARLVQQALSETSCLPALSADDRGAQAVANIERFLDLLRDLEARVGPDPRRIVRMLRRAVDESPQESEGAPKSRQGAGIVISTVHGAKGLEFPVVCVPDLQRRFQGDNVRDGGWTTGLRKGVLGDDTLIVMEVLDAEGKGQRSAIDEVTKRQERAERDAEMKRILYVAMTRAQDHLVLQGVTDKVLRPDGEQARTVPPIADGKDWLDWTLAGIGLDGETLAALSPGADAMHRLADVPVLVSIATPTVTATPTPAARETDPPVLHLVPHDHDPGRLVRFSPTDVALFRECPARFRHKVIDGLPEHRLRGLGRHVEWAPTLGTLIHETLEAGGPVAGTLPPAVARRIRRIASAEKWDHVRMERHVFEHAERGMTALARLEAGLSGQTPPRRFSEVPVDQVVAPRLRLSGRVDRLYMTDGGAVVVDHKSDATDGDALRTALDAGHLDQIDGYESFIHRRGGTIFAPGALAFTSTGELVRHTGHAATEGLIDRIVEGDDAAFPAAPRDPAVCAGCGFFAKYGGPCAGPR